MDKLWCMLVVFLFFYTVVNMNHLDLYVPIWTYYKHHGQTKTFLQKNMNNRLALLNIFYFYVENMCLIYFKYKIYKN